MKNALLAFVLCFPFVVSAQIDSIKLVTAQLRKTNDTIKAISTQLIQTPSLKEAADFAEFEKNISAINTFTDSKLTMYSAMENSAIKLRLMQNELDNLAWYRRQLIIDSKLFKTVADTRREIKWIRDSKPEGMGLSSCSECLFASHIAVYVLRRNNQNKMDTLNCWNVEFQKMVNDKPISKRKQKCSSVTCNDNEFMASTGRNYTFQIREKSNSQIYTYTGIEVRPRKYKAAVQSIYLTIE